MADYFPVLSRAIAALPTNTGESRRAVYERARAAIIKQLRGIDPPLPEEDISRERMQLEDAIRRIEADNAGKAAPAPQQPAPSPSQPQVARPSPQPAVARAPQPPYRQDPPVERPQAELPQTDRNPPERPQGPKRGPEVRADGRPIIRAAGEPGAARPRSRSGPAVALGALLVIALAVGAFAGRRQIAALFGGPSATQTASTDAPKSDGAAPADAPSASETPGGKSNDSLLSGPAPSSEPAKPAETEVARAPDAAPQDQPAPPVTAPEIQAPAAQTPPPVQQPQAQQPGALVAQRAILYEEGSDKQSGEQIDGSVVWRTESVSAGQNQPLETALRGDIDIPARNVKATLTIRRNVDATLPASHTIEIQFKLPDNFPNAGVANVPGILMKADEAARGAPVSGLSVRVTNGFFLIGLSNIENERTVNEQLLRDRGWIDVPILYDNGRRAVLTLEKGTPGTQAFTDAFAAWQTAAAAGGSTARP